jgi:hypothetical protein
MERVKIMLSAKTMLKSAVRLYDNFWVVTRNDNMHVAKNLNMGVIEIMFLF